MRLLQQIHGLRGLLGYQQINRFLIAASCLEQLLRNDDYTKFLRAEDCLSTLHAFQQLGVEIEEEEEVIKIHGRGSHSFVQPTAPIDMGNSGTTSRLLMGILAGQPLQRLCSVMLRCLNVQWGE